MARPEVEPKTPLGARLRQVRNHFEVSDRGEFAERLGVGKSSLALYERGERVPDADVLAAYRHQYGVNINWLVMGKGHMFTADDAEEPALVPKHLLLRLAELTDDQRAKALDLFEFGLNSAR